MLIRDAGPDDWTQIYPFFSGIVEAGETYAYPTGLASAGARALWMEPPPNRVVVAVEGDQVLGSAKMGPNRAGRGSHIATASFMVDPIAEHRGVGRRLAEDMIAWATANGYRGIQFNAVVETNTSAVRLWQALGFVVIGTVPGAFRHPKHGFVGLHVMYRSLA